MFMDIPNTVLCEEELGIASARDFNQSLHEAFLSSKAIIVDLSKTQHIDTAIAQIICLFDRDSKYKGIDLKWHYSDAVFETMKTLGLDNFLGVPGVCDSMESDSKQG